MPRPADPRNSAAQARTARWRLRTREAGRPEMSAVDVACADAVARYAADVWQDQAAAEAARPFLAAIMKETVAGLVEAGYDRGEARRQVLRRVGLRLLERMVE